MAATSENFRFYTKKYEPIFVCSVKSSNFPNKYQFSSILSTVIRHLQLDEWIDSMIQYQLNKSMGFRYMHQTLHSTHHSTPMLLSSFHFKRLARFSMLFSWRHTIHGIWIYPEWNYRFSTSWKYKLGAHLQCLKAKCSIHIVWSSEFTYICINEIGQKA